jgi:hypothetical protein
MNANKGPQGEKKVKPASVGYGRLQKGTAVLGIDIQS